VSDRRAQLLDVHRRVLEGDPSAPSVLFLEIHGVLVRVLRGKFRRSLTDDQVIDLATDAILEYLRAPDRYDPNRASLFSYIAVIATGDALNVWKSVKAKKKNFQKFVELSESDRNSEDGSSDLIDAAKILEKHGSEIVDDDSDVTVLQLMLMGEKDTDVYAAAILADHLSEHERRTIVKQRRDKLEKRLIRLKAQL